MYSVKRFLIAATVIAIILLAVIMGGLRVSLANIDYFRAEVEYLVSELILPGAHFSSVQGGWNRFNPVLRIKNASVNLPDRSQPIFVDNLAVEFDLWSSLREQAPIVVNVSGQIEKLELRKDRGGRWWANDFEIGGSAEEVIETSLKQLLVYLPRYLNLDLRRLIIKDELSDDSFQIDRLSAYISHQDDQYFVQLGAALPAELGHGVELKSVISAERSIVYLNSSKLEVHRLAQLFGVETGILAKASLSGETWVNLADNKIVSVNGEVLLESAAVKISPDRPSFSLAARTRFNLKSRGNQWQLNQTFDDLMIEQKPIAGFRSHLELTNNAGSKQLTGWIDSLELDNLSVVSNQIAQAEIREPIQQGQLKGILNDLLIDVEIGNPQGLRLSASAANVSSKPFLEIPGVENLNGKFIIAPNKIAAKLKGSKLRLDFNEHFRAPMEIDDFSLAAVAQQTASGVILTVDEISGKNQDITVGARLWLESDQHEKPFLYIRGDFDQGQGSATSKYLPVKILPPATLAWLDQGIKDARVSNGDFVFHGRLDDIQRLSQNSAGELFVGFDIEQADVFFAAKWLKARQGKGKVQFHNMSMDIDLDQVSYGRIDNASARISIADYTDSILNIAISTEVDTGRALEAWTDMPIGQKYKSIVARLDSFTGKAKTDISIQIPLADDEINEQVKVSLELKNAGAKSEAWGLDLHQVDGLIEITEDSISASQLKARYFGDPVTIEITTDKATGNTLVSGRGLISSKAVLNKLPDPITRTLSGKSNWQVGLKFPNRIIDQQPFLEISLSSILKNSAINLPAPFTKVAGSLRPVNAKIDFFPGKIEFESGLGADFRGKGVLRGSQDSDYRLEALDLAFASKLKPTLLEGISIYGSIPFLSVEDWTSQFADVADYDSAQLQSVELRINQAKVLGQTIEAVTLDVERTPDNYLALIDSSLIKGTVLLPLDRAKSTLITADLEYLKILPSENDTGIASMTPADLTDFNIKCQNLHIFDMELRDLSATAKVDANTFLLETVSVRHERVYLNASAKWDYVPASQQHFSNMKVVVQGPDFGQTLASLGFGNSIMGGAIDFSTELSWADALVAFDWDSLIGEAHLNLEDGVLNNVEPGTGRLVGLFSLSALPRRLSLDFKDMLIKGMEFDKISGNFKVDGENLITENMKLDGESAKISVTGTTGLQRKDYDQRVVVVPKIRQTLPLIGAVSAGNAVGWGLLILQNLFKKVIDKVVEIEYRITGSWDNPTIDLVEAVEVDGDSSNVDEFGQLPGQDIKK